MRALVGRDRELAVFDELVAHERGVAVLTGEPGIGKTRLLEELARRVVAAGGTCAWGRMLEVGLTPAFWPWLQILGALETGDDRAPSLGSVDRADAGSRLGLFAEVVAYLGRRAAERPIALLFDDLHVADPSSLQLLEYALPLLAGKRVVVVLAARDRDATRDVAVAIARIQRAAVRVPLARLAHADVAELVGERGNIDRVFELSEGNPLFVEELVAAGLRLPELSSVRAVVRERIGRLPEPARAVVVAAAIAGREFRSEIVADMLGVAQLDGLKPVLDLGMVAMTRPDRYRFSHALIAEAIADELDPSERARLHLRAANAIEHRGGDPSALAHHLLAAGHLAAAAAVDAAQHAARAAMAQLAFEDAAALLEQAVHALALAAPDDRRRRAELVCARAEALQHATQPARAIPLCDEAAALARELGDGELLARIALARGIEFRFGRTDPLLVDALREALAALGDRHVQLRARMLARLAAAEQPADDPAGPVALAFEAIELASSLDARDRLDVTYIATSALVEYVPAEQLEPIHRDVLELARGVDRSIAVHTRMRMCFTALERSDRMAYEHRVAEFTADARGLGLPSWLRHVEMLAALSAILDGRFDEAEHAVQHARAIATTMGDDSAAWLIDVHVALRAYVQTLPVDDRVRARIESYPRGRAPLKAWFATQRGDRVAVNAALAEVARLPRDMDMLAMWTNAVAFVGDRDAAAAGYAALLPHRGGVIVNGMVGCIVVDLVDRQLLLLATLLERWDAVDTHAANALANATALGSPVWIAKVRADLADAHEARGDRARANELRAVVRVEAERLAMPGLAARVGATARAAVPQSRGGVELARVGELWTITGFGEQVHVADSRGMQMLAKLVAAPGRELHALELAGGSDAGNAGPALDATARDRYRARLAQLVAERDQAEAWNDGGRLERANAEIEALSAELERAFGLGGRERKVGAASERARSNAQRRIAHALDQIKAASARIGDHFVACVKTGTYCVYSP